MDSETQSAASKLLTMHRSFGHAIRAYKLEVKAESALPTLSNERLTPPATRLLRSMIGAISTRKLMWRRIFYSRVLQTTTAIVCCKKSRAFLCLLSFLPENRFLQSFFVYPLAVLINLFFANRRHAHILGCCHFLSFVFSYRLHLLKIIIEL